MENSDAPTGSHEAELVRRDARKDANQAAIVDALRRIGASVEIENATGRPDLLVGFRRRNFLIEVKAPGGALTPAQIEFFALWRGQAAIVESLDDARKVLGC